MAARLRDLSVDAVGLAGQGIRDVTRIADSDPALWTQILAGNAGAVADVDVYKRQLLGHASVATTQIYTLVTVQHLREVYAQTHPRAR